MMMPIHIHGSVYDAHTILLGVDEHEEDFPPDFKEYIQKEQLNWSRIDFGWVFWSQLDHSADLIRQAIQKLMRVFHKELDCSLVQFWAPTTTSEGRTLLTTQFQPFALGRTSYDDTDARSRLCEYRMGMCREYFYADAECAQELLGLPGRVFLNKLPESTPGVEHYTLKEYPQSDLALRCEIESSWALPVFEYSSRTCVGVLEIVSLDENDIEYWHDKESLGRMYDIFQMMMPIHIDGSVDDAHTILLGVDKGEEDFPHDFKEYIQKEQLNWSRIYSGWVFWSQLDNSADLIRHALQKLMRVLSIELVCSLVQFWAATKTSEGRTLLTTQFQPFALGATNVKGWLCSYRMGMCREYNNSFYADAECAQEQLGLPGRVFLNQLPESIPHVELYTLKEYPQRDLALRCKIESSVAVPVFEHSSHTCVGVLEIVSLDEYDEYWHDKKFLGRMYDIFQKFGLRCFDGYEHRKMQYRDKNEALTVAFQELKMVYKSVCNIHKLPFALAWVSCHSCNDLLQSPFHFSVLDYSTDEEDDDDYWSSDLFAFTDVSKVCLLRKGHISGRILPLPNLLYCSDVKQFSIAEFPLVPYARCGKLGGWFTMCLQSSYTGDELYVLEFFLPESDKNDENILAELRLILGTMEKYFKTFKLASRQGLGEALSVEVIDFQNGQKSHSIQMIPATRFIPSLELVQDGGVMLQQDQQDQPSMDVINSGMYVDSEAQNYNLPILDSMQNGKVTKQVDSSDQQSMDPSNKGENVVTAERNIPVVSSSKERKRKMQDRKHKKAGVRIEVSLEEILKCSNMKREDAARELKVSISTFKRVCRGYDIYRWPHRNIENANSFRPSPVENQRQIPQLNSDLPSNQALVGVSHIKPWFQDSHTVTMWAKFENSKIKFRLSLSSRFEELQQEVAKRLNLKAGSYNVKYKDEEDVEDEWTLMSCDEDLQECMHNSRSLDKTSVVVLLELKQPITNLNPGLSGEQQTLFSPLRRQGLQSAEGELSIVPTVHTTGGVWLDAHFSYTPTIDEEETINKCMQDGSFRGEFVDGCWISNITVMEYREMLDHYLSHCHFFGPNVVKNFKESGRLLNTILLPKTEKIFFPILRDRHWMLLVIDVKKKYFLWLDSMRCEREKKYSEDFAHFLNHEFVFKRLTEQNEWPIKYPENTPIQDNGNDCGVYMMAFMISLAVGDKLPQLSQAQVKRMRRTICLELKKWDIIPQCPLVDYKFLHIQERKKIEALNEKLHKESTAALRDEVFIVSERRKHVKWADQVVVRGKEELI